MRSIRDTMAVFGLVSSAFDFMIFGLLLWVFRTGPDQFRTAWFVESLLTELLIVFVVRTRAPFYRSLAAWPLLLSTAGVAAIAVAAPYAAWAPLLNFTPLPAPLVAVILVVTALYVGASELAKRVLYRRWATTAAASR
jgi:Mg2+-importing ATPase